MKIDRPRIRRPTLTLAVLMLLFLPSLAVAQRDACGGHRIHWIGGAPRAMLDYDRRPKHGPPDVQDPGMSARDRELWNAMIFDAYDAPDADPSAKDHWRTAIPLEERHTMVMDRGDAMSFRLCIQSADDSYTGQRLERYADEAWWRKQVQRFTNFQWRGDIEIDTCTGDVPRGWVYVREGDEGEVDDENLAYASSWRRFNPHGTAETWVRSEIVWHSAEKVRDTGEDWFESTLAHELGHVLGLWHVPPSSGFVMMGSGGMRTWPDKERWLAQWAHDIGPGVKYPGFVFDTPVTALPLVGIVLLALTLLGITSRHNRRT